MLFNGRVSSSYRQAISSKSVVLTTRCVSQDSFKIAILDQHTPDIAKGSF